MTDIERAIRIKFRVKGVSPVPYAGWLESNRDHLAELFAEVGFKVGAEIGVRWGEYSEILLKANPGLKLYCIDSWAPYDRTPQDKQDRIFRRARKVLSRYGAILIRKPSMEALADIPDGSLDFVYIDAMHDFDNVMVDIIGWSKKVKHGGVISGHDFTRLPGCGVIPAVEAYTRGHSILQWYVTRNEVWPSWFWVNP